MIYKIAADLSKLKAFTEILRDNYGTNRGMIDSAAQEYARGVRSIGVEALKHPVADDHLHNIAHKAITNNLLKDTYDVVAKHPEEFKHIVDNPRLLGDSLPAYNHPWVEEVKQNIKQKLHARSKGGQYKDGLFLFDRDLEELQDNALNKDQVHSFIDHLLSLKQK